jgi:hypothetical protein
MTSQGGATRANFMVIRILRARFYLAPFSAHRDARNAREISLSAVASTRTKGTLRPLSE